LTVLLALGVGAGVVLQRLGTEASSRRHEEARIQLRWLARTALLRGERGDFRIEVPQGRVYVRVRVADGVTFAEASLPGFGVARARDLPAGLEERYEREVRPAAP
jgi:hypothetical protein